MAYVKKSVNDKIRMYEKWKIKMYKFVHEFGILLFVGGIPKMKNLLGQINIFKAMETKPNFSELAREYGIDRRTVKKYYEGYESKPKTRNKQSKLDKYYPENSVSQKGNKKLNPYRCKNMG